MSRKEPVADPAITQKVIQQLSARGLRTPCRINVQTRKGEVTLSGHVVYPHQRDAAIAAIRSIDGIRRVHVQIQVRPPTKHQYKTLPPQVKEAVAAAVEAEATAVTPETAEAAAAKVAAAPPAIESASSTTDFDVGPAPVRRPSPPPSPATPGA